MSRDLVTVTTDVTVAEALLEMARRKVHNIPVVDEDGAFVGLVSLRRLTHTMLPMAARVDVGAFRMDIGFLADQSDAYLDRLQEIGKRPVGELMEKRKKLRFCSPDTPIPKLLQLLSENPTSLPVVVVEGKNQRVIGMVSNWDVLTKIAVTLLADGQKADTADAADPADASSGDARH
jgi:CBS domain-containing protein